MIEGLVAKRYAKALFEVANERKMLDQVEQDLNLIVKIMKDTEGFLTFFRHPKISFDVKKELITSVLQKQISTISQNFLFQLIDNQRIEYAEEILFQYVILANEVRKVVDVEAVTAVELEESDKNSIIQMFSKKMNKTVRLTNVIDPSILGGMIVKMGDRIYDGSLSSQLSMMKKNLLESRV